MASWIAAATSISTNNRVMIPLMLITRCSASSASATGTAAGDMQSAPNFCSAAPAGTTLNGEGLQHEDGHNHILASTIPNSSALRPHLRPWKWR